jgi:hypothetical protein
MILIVSIYIHAPPFRQDVEIRNPKNESLNLVPQEPASQIVFLVGYKIFSQFYSTEGVFFVENDKNC